MTYSPARKQDTGKLRNIKAMNAEKLLPLADEIERSWMHDTDAVEKIKETLKLKGWSHSIIGQTPQYTNTDVDDVPVEKMAPPSGADPIAAATAKATDEDTLLEDARAGRLAQLAELSKRTFESYSSTNDYVMEPKMDGWRILAFVTEDGVKMFSRNGKTYEGQVPEICEELTKLPVGTVIDGEMAAIRYENDESVIDDWGAIQSILGSSKPVPLEVRKAATYMVFDLIRLDGKNARPLPFSDRRNLLEGLFDAIDFDLDRVALVEQTEPSAEAHAHYVEVGFEGSIVKRRDSAYSSNARGAGWDKVKPNETLDGVVMGFREGKSSFAGLIGSIEFGQYKDGKLELVGACSGMDYKTREEISANRDAWKNKVIEVCYEKSIGDAPRFPRFKRVRKDKDPQECVSD